MGNGSFTNQLLKYYFKQYQSSVAVASRNKSISKGTFGELIFHGSSEEYGWPGISLWDCKFCDHIINSLYWYTLSCISVGGAPCPFVHHALFPAQHMLLTGWSAVRSLSSYGYFGDWQCKTTQQSDGVLLNHQYNIYRSYLDNSPILNNIYIQRHSSIWFSLSLLLP